MYPGKKELVGRDPHAYGFERLYESCLTSSTLVFIGFAFRDNDVLSVVFSAVNQRKLNNQEPLCIVVIDPYISKEVFIQRIKESRWEVSVPMSTSDFEIHTIRNNFPPSEKDMNMILKFIR